MASRDMADSAYVPEIEAASMLGMEPHQLRRLRKTGKGPAVARAGGRNVYFVDDLERYMEQMDRKRG